jgi:hypothetical protein
MRPDCFHPLALVATLVGTLAACSSEPNRTALVDAASEDAVEDDRTVPDVGDVPADLARDKGSNPAEAGVTPPADVSSDGLRPGPDVPDFEDGGIVGPTYDFVLTGFTIDDNGSGGPPNPLSHARGVAGFNLDGRFTGAIPRADEECNHGDFFSELDPDQNMGTCTAGSARGGTACVGGVDNQLPAIANALESFGGDVQGTLASLLRNGRMSVVVRVSGVDGAPGPTLHDDQVTVRIYPVAWPLFDDCTQIGTPGLRYAIDDESLGVPGDLARARFRFNARIVAGRVMTLPTGSASTPDFVLALPFGTTVASLHLFRTQLRFDLTADRALRGNLGGSTLLRDAVDAVLPALPPGISPSIVHSVTQSFVDIREPEHDPLGCRYPNGSIGLGMGFTGVRAEVAPTTVRGPQPGRCGS